MWLSQLEKQQQMFLELFVKKTTLQKSLIFFTLDAIANSTSEFIYNLGERINFLLYYRRCNGNFVSIEMAKRKSDYY